MAIVLVRGQLNLVLAIILLGFEGYNLKGLVVDILYCSDEELAYVRLAYLVPVSVGSYSHGFRLENVGLSLGYNSSYVLSGVLFVLKLGQIKNECC